eukprot:gnl/TRDRNA2_/TRDRNA2_178636_c0_seq1.p1 gnl/TRDRNA2_/TRDRNA2_178636_c0~~gnl/TRDRNA2_/TRDRNA2_178636_c0_seq1.p1  ORF type:complete len:478 (+),score=72.72 gnl/TRDRNA2_/TRDRNA2_178636_c0_seq1:79-1512(+)
MAYPIPISCLAEFIGTFFLVFTVGCNVLTGSPVWGVISIAFVLMVMIYALAGVSGANFNPAVTCSLILTSKMEPLRGLAYTVTQLIAGLIAGEFAKWLFSNTVNKLALAEPSGRVGLAELLYTFMLCFVVLNVAATKKNQPNQHYGIAIGLVIVAGGYGAGAISGGCFNPAVALGVKVDFLRWLFYTAFELLGALVAVLLFMVMRPEEFVDGLFHCSTQDYEHVGNEAKDKSAFSKFEKLLEDNGIITGLSEFLGTFFLVLTVGLNVLAGSPAAAFSIAASLTSMIYALASISGAHFNPAVTVAILASGRGKCSVIQAVGYIFAQICGAICAGFMYVYLADKDAFTLGPGATFTANQAAVAEGFFTFVLAFVVLIVATSKDPLGDLYGFAIGACVTVGGNAIGNVSGGHLNPAVSLGMVISSQAGDAGAIALYLTAQIVGGVLAAGAFRLLHAEEYKDSRHLCVETDDEEMEGSASD